MTIKQLQFTGWPKIAILTLPREKVIIALSTIVCSYLVPILISCFVYVAMICIKKRKFFNKVETSTKAVALHIVENDISTISKTQINFKSGQVLERELDPNQIFEREEISNQDSSKHNSPKLIKDQADFYDEQEV